MWLKNNQYFGAAIDKTKQFTDRRFDKAVRIKYDMEDESLRYLDKTKFLSLFSCLEGYMQYISSHWLEPDCHGLDYDHFKAEKRKVQDTCDLESMNFYDDFKSEELLVATVECGGPLQQPICLYDFTVKKLSHDCLNFSTRH